MPGAAPRWAVHIPVAGDDRAVALLARLLERVAALGTGCAHVGIVHDGPDPAPLERLLARSGLPGSVVANPRGGRGWPWAAAPTAALLHGVARLRRGVEPDWVLSLDTDTLPTSPFAEELDALARGAGSAGLIGRVEQCPELGRRLRKLMLPVSLWRLPRPHLRFGAPWNARGRRVQEMLRGGVPPAGAPLRFCQGGAFVLTRRCLDAWHAAGVLEDPLRFVDLTLPVDALAACLCGALGLTLADARDRFACFPSADTLATAPPHPAALFVHPVKQPGPADERLPGWARRMP